ncbi:DUF1523 family protein [Candidatus Nitrosacidococcus sp. I8]|uniref:DUF1523 family protein n=1 Tax=Candidatus Nitrosacidococcus sp. I8 TaxID=2942908 RepID=UPI002227BA40|nr:DUF1523 family protein [Candidatus Nitrosacidococcus sp. I8]CAH9017914.1 hypothetical protein NURINAE_00623 [Candidatus Nitrosacidococcus sp. I8]
MNTLKTVLFSLIAIIAILFLSYQWPRNAIFTVVNTEVKRTNNKDQYRITAIKQANNKQMVFRNEDSLSHLKFNSADIQGLAAYAAQEKTPVKIRYYGWRSNLFSWFWNVTKVKIIKEKD